MPLTVPRAAGGAYRLLVPERAAPMVPGVNEDPLIVELLRHNGWWCLPAMPSDGNGWIVFASWTQQQQWSDLVSAIGLVVTPSGRLTAEVSLPGEQPAILHVRESVEQAARAVAHAIDAYDQATGQPCAAAPGHVLGIAELTRLDGGHPACGLAAYNAQHRMLLESATAALQGGDFWTDVIGLSPLAEVLAVLLVGDGQWDVNAHTRASSAMLASFLDRPELLAAARSFTPDPPAPGRPVTVTPHPGHDAAPLVELA